MAEILTVALRAPEAVRSLILIEAPPVVGPRDHAFVAAARRLSDAYERDGVTAALQAYALAMGEPSWVETRPALDPVEVERIESDAETFFAADIPALLGWGLATPSEHPVLSIGGADSPPMFAAARNAVRMLFPQSEEVLVAGGGHTVAATHSVEVAAAITDFIQRLDRGSR